MVHHLEIALHCRESTANEKNGQNDRSERVAQTHTSPVWGLIHMCLADRMGEKREG